MLAQALHAALDQSGGRGGRSVEMACDLQQRAAFQMPQANGFALVVGERGQRRLSRAAPRRASRARWARIAGHRARSARPRRCPGQHPATVRGGCRGCGAGCAGEWPPRCCGSGYCAASRAAPGSRSPGTGGSCDTLPASSAARYRRGRGGKRCGRAAAVRPGDSGTFGSAPAAAPTPAGRPVEPVAADRKCPANLGPSRAPTSVGTAPAIGRCAFFHILTVRSAGANERLLSRPWGGTAQEPDAATKAFGAGVTSFPSPAG